MGNLKTSHAQCLLFLPLPALLPLPPLFLGVAPLLLQRKLEAVPLRHRLVSLPLRFGQRTLRRSRDRYSKQFKSPLLQLLLLTLRLLMLLLP